MHGWETVVGAIGGLVLGLGLGVLIGRRNERTERVDATSPSDHARLRMSVIPILEERAAAVGVPPSERADGEADPVTVAVTLADSIRRHRDQEALPFSDTLELSRADLKKREQ